MTKFEVYIKISLLFILMFFDDNADPLNLLRLFKFSHSAVSSLPPLVSSAGSDRQRFRSPSKNASLN